METVVICSKMDTKDPAVLVTEQPVSNVTINREPPPSYDVINMPPASGPQPVTSATEPTSTTPITIPRESSSKGQSLLISATGCWLTYGGMDFAQGLGWNLTSDVAATPQFQYCWSIGVIIGCLLGSIAIVRLPKMVIYIIAGTLELIDAIIFVSAPREYSSIIAARYIGGIGIGILTLTFIIHNSEMSVQNSRGIFACKEILGITLGITVQVIYDAEWLSDMKMTENQAHGIFGIVFSVAAFASLLAKVESPIFLLQRNDEPKARVCMKKLLNPLISDELNNHFFEEAKTYVSDGESQTLADQLRLSVGPFFKLLFYRAFVAFSFSLPLSYSIISSTYIAEGIQHSWQLATWGILRKIAALLTAFIFLDRLGRKGFALVALFCMGALMLSMAGIYANPVNVISPYYMLQVCNLGMAFQFLSGMFICSTSVYLSEAFPMRIKSYCIALILCFEQVIQIIVIVSYENTTEFYFSYFLTVGIILLLGVVAFAMLMPETKNMTLRAAGDRFQRKYYDLKLK